MDANKPVTFNDMCQPGVFRIECIPKKKALFVQTINVLMHARSYFDALEAGNCTNPQLQKDYNQYGNDQFDLEFPVIGKEYWDPTKRYPVFEELKKSWPNELYADDPND